MAALEEGLETTAGAKLSTPSAGETMALTLQGTFTGLYQFLGPVQDADAHF